MLVRKRRFVLNALIIGSCYAAWSTASAAGSDCDALAAVDLSTVPEAPLQLTAVTQIAANDDLPEYCRVTGYITPNVGIEMWLPDSVDWNGKLLMGGCGGFCGAMFTARCEDPLRRGYACIVSDMGHRSTALDGKWAYNNRQAEIDFAHRSTHVAAVAGKAIVAAAYGRG